MIDLRYDRGRMLEEIDSSHPVPTDLSDPEFISRDEVSLTLQAEHPEALLPRLREALTRRFDKEAEERLDRDLLYPLKKGLGNAYKWGNRRDATKSIVVDATVTREGAVVAISDEGQGFDPQAVVARMSSDARYFFHGGSGFAQFRKTGSLVSYADHGRTLLVRFLRDDPGSPATAADREELGLAVDESAMRARIAERVPDLIGAAELVSCAIYLPVQRGTRGAERDIHYRLHYRLADSDALHSKTFRGRLVPPGTARARCSASRSFHGTLQGLGTHLDAPLPAGYLDEPSLVLVRSRRGVDFKTHLKALGDDERQAEVIRSVGLGLGHLHRSDVQIEPVETLSESFEVYRSAARSLARELADAGSVESSRAERLRDVLERRASAIPECVPAPIHEDFSWSRLATDRGRVLFPPFAPSRRGHPGWDVGGFLGDLLRFHRLRRKGRQESHGAARERFLEAYADGASPSWFDDLPFFTACALLLRIQQVASRQDKKGQSKRDVLFEACEELL